ncbi:MAG: hypothetical protein HC895_04030 [Leptolyngbyaceae cyanobacterium SM1_3_5]|nr:hypothetical protein [Leptolyngbyaceae cyanobacterium SM1_3_5]
MKSSMDWKEYQRLELITPPRKTLKQKIQDFWQAVVADLKGSTEPRLWESIDRNGQTAWNGYDPATGRSVHNLSESDVLTWLEQRHYSHTDFDQPKLPKVRRSYYQVMR